MQFTFKLRNGVFMDYKIHYIPNIAYVTTVFFIRTSKCLVKVWSNTTDWPLFQQRVTLYL